MVAEVATPEQEIQLETMSGLWPLHLSGRCSSALGVSPNMVSGIITAAAMDPDGKLLAEVMKVGESILPSCVSE